MKEVVHALDKLYSNVATKHVVDHVAVCMVTVCVVKNDHPHTIVLSGTIQSAVSITRAVYARHTVTRAHHAEIYVCVFHNQWQHIVLHVKLQNVHLEVSIKLLVDLHITLVQQESVLPK